MLRYDSSMLSHTMLFLYDCTYLSSGRIELQEFGHLENKSQKSKVKSQKTEDRRQKTKTRVNEIHFAHFNLPHLAILKVHCDDVDVDLPGHVDLHIYIYVNKNINI